jgi:hypothetical protein
MSCSSRWSSESNTRLRSGRREQGVDRLGRGHVPDLTPGLKLVVGMGLTLGLFLTLPAQANTPPATPTAASTTAAAAATGHPQLPGSRLSGQATLRFFGLQVYHARLWIPPGFQADTLGPQPLVLELEYLRKLKGQAIAERSIEEMRRAGPFTDEQAARWQAEMTRLFPDVKAGDRITGIHRPGEGAAFLYNDQPVGLIADPVFSRLFFGIWLAPTTSEPAMRETLLGRAGPR